VLFDSADAGWSMASSTNGREPAFSPEVKRLVSNLTLLDDTLASKAIDNNIEAMELLLRLIIGSDIKVSSSKGQYDLKNPYPKGRSIRLDAHARDIKGREYDLEFQRSIKGSHPRRLRFYAGMMDVRMLKEKQEFEELKDSYVVFVCGHDRFKKNLPVYHIDKIVRETGEVFDDGSHMVYFNGEYKGDDDLGRLAHDFNCKHSKDMFYKPLADAVKHFKETEEGNKNMCEAVERYARKQAISALTNAVKNVMKEFSVSVDRALDILKVEGNDRLVITKELKM